MDYSPIEWIGIIAFCIITLIVIAIAYGIKDGINARFKEKEEYRREEIDLLYRSARYCRVEKIREALELSEPNSEEEEKILCLLDEQDLSRFELSCVRGSNKRADPNYTKFRPRLHQRLIAAAHKEAGL